MRRAFDSLPKPFLVFAWIRLGVLEDIARYLVEMDVGGYTVIRSPIALQKMEEEGETLLELENLFFGAFRGTGQGDVSSPLNWDAVLDTLMIALATVDEGAFLTRHWDGGSCSQGIRG
jgi:hypothetical protein